MNKPIEFSNIIKYDKDKCIQCEKCVNNCDTYALTLTKNFIDFDKNKCYACRKCLSVCKNKALYYNVNDGKINDDNVIALVPFDANKEILNKTYSQIITYELGEKVKIIETAFEMEKESSKKINNERNLPLIISDIDNIELYLDLKYPHLINYLSKVKNIYYISSFLCRLNNNKNNKIVAYGVPFESKLYFDEIRIIDEICDIPFKTNTKYNILDILNTYIHICKFNNNKSINMIDISNNNTLKLSNKYIEVDILFINEINYLSQIDYSKYDFIFLCKNNIYMSSENLLKDNEVNQIYKTKLKEPRITTQLFDRR